MNAQRNALTAMYAGLLLTVAASIVPFVDHATANVLADHIRAAYPRYSTERIDAAATTYLSYLCVLGAAGIAGWVWSIRAVRRRRRWAREAVTAIFALAACVAAFDLLVRDTSGDTGLPPLLGWVGIAPCLAGLLAVALLWRQS